MLDARIVSLTIQWTNYVLSYGMVVLSTTRGSPISIVLVDGVVITLATPLPLSSPLSAVARVTLLVIVQLGSLCFDPQDVRSEFAWSWRIFVCDCTIVDDRESRLQAK